jgi:TonB family protein
MMRKSLRYQILFLLSTLCLAQQASSGSTGSATAIPNSTPPVVALGEPISVSTPKYPKDALKERIEGSVVLTLLVSEKGQVENATVVSGNPELAEAAVEAVHKWKYTPYEGKDHRPMEVQTVVTIEFNVTHDGPAVFASYRPLSIPLVYRVGNGIKPPQIIHQADPEYSKWSHGGSQGTCVLELIVDDEGVPRNLRVVKAIGDGLDEKAVEAVRQWRFRPATKDGKPVAVLINVEVTFHVL